MAALDYSQFSEDLTQLLVWLSEDCRAAWPELTTVQIIVDRAFTEQQFASYAVIVPEGITMRGQEDGVVAIPYVEQSYSFTIFKRTKIRKGDNVILDKVAAANALVKILMASLRYHATFERPFVPTVDLAEEKPNPDYSVFAIEFTVRGVNFRHAAPAG